jgi:hypothetical protein
MPQSQSVYPITGGSFTAPALTDVKTDPAVVENYDALVRELERRNELDAAAAAKATLPTMPPDPAKAQSTEPVLTAGLVAGLPAALFSVLVSFNIWSPTDAQMGALSGLYLTLLSVAVAVARSKAYSPATVVRLLAEKG